LQVGERLTPLAVRNLFCYAINHEQEKVKLLPIGHQWIGWRWRADHWERIILAVRLLAETGVSTALDLLWLLSQKTSVSPNANSLRRLVYQTFADEQVSHKIVDHRTIRLPFSAGVPVS